LLYWLILFAAFKGSVKHEKEIADEIQVKDIETYGSVQ
jgi:hypothetical protein